MGTDRRAGGPGAPGTTVPSQDEVLWVPEEVGLDWNLSHCSQPGDNRCKECDKNAKGKYLREIDSFTLET